MKGLAKTGLKSTRRRPSDIPEPTGAVARQLREIWDRIHEWVPPQHARDFGMYVERRSLTAEEWDLVQKAVEGGLPATIVGHGWMGGCALVVYEPRQPLYPGTEEETGAVPVIQIPATQLPGNDRNKGVYAINPSVEKPTPGGAWDLFTKLCNTPRNLELLKREDIEPPKPIGFYQY
jgi:hypothetical protein